MLGKLYYSGESDSDSDSCKLLTLYSELVVLFILSTHLCCEMWVGVEGRSDSWRCQVRRSNGLELLLVEATPLFAPDEEKAVKCAVKCAVRCAVTCAVKCAPLFGPPNAISFPYLTNDYQKPCQ